MLYVNERKPYEGYMWVEWTTVKSEMNDQNTPHYGVSHLVRRAAHVGVVKSSDYYILLNYSYSWVMSYYLEASGPCSNPKSNAVSARRHILRGKPTRCAQATVRQTVPEWICGLWHASHANSKEEGISKSRSNDPRKKKRREMGHKLRQRVIKGKRGNKNKCLLLKIHIIKQWQIGHYRLRNTARVTRLVLLSFFSETNKNALTIT